MMHIILIEWSSQSKYKYILKYQLVEYDFLLTITNALGLRVIYDLRRAPGERVENVNVLCTKCPIPRYEVLQNNETYPIILNSYLAQGGDNFGIFKKACRDIKNFGKTKNENSDFSFPYFSAKNQNN